MNPQSPIPPNLMGIMIKKSGLQWIILFLITFALTQCKKQDRFVDKPNSEKDQVLSTLDSIYFYAKQIYLWNDQLPEHIQFNPRKFYTTQSKEEMDIYKRELFELSQYALNPVSGRPYEYNEQNLSLPKYSTLLQLSSKDNNSAKQSTISVDANNKFGLSFVAVGEDDLRLLYVDKNSPAGMAGLVRSDKIVRINNATVQTNNTFTNFLSDALKNPFVDIEFQNFTDGRSAIQKVRLTGRPYEPNPVLAYRKLNINSREVGYIAYLNFTEENNTRKYLEPILYSFANADIKDLIIDLRYNGGGFQNTCKYIANQIAPANARGKVMFSEHYNKLMQQRGATILTQQPLEDEFEYPFYLDGRIATLFDIDYSVENNTSYFASDGLLNGLQTIYFIVSNRTASSSELLINSLKPYINVVLIGVSDRPNQPVKTYGKPVGFIDLHINRFALFLPMYQTKNAIQYGDFFDGLPSDYSVLDDPTIAFGDVQDPTIITMMKHAGLTANTILLPNKMMQRNQGLAKKKDFTLKYFYNSIYPIGSMIKTKREIKIKSKPSNY